MTKRYYGTDAPRSTGPHPDPNEQVIIRKRGYFYRPDWCGYTASIHEAGRYPRQEAEDHATTSDEVTVHSPSEFT